MPSSPPCGGSHGPLGGAGGQLNQEWNTDFVALIGHRVPQPHTDGTHLLACLIHILEPSLRLYSGDSKGTQQGGFAFILSFWVSVSIWGDWRGELVTHCNVALCPVLTDMP